MIYHLHPVYRYLIILSSIAPSIPVSYYLIITCTQFTGILLSYHQLHPWWVIRHYLITCTQYYRICNIIRPTTYSTVLCLVIIDILNSAGPCQPTDKSTCVLYTCVLYCTHVYCTRVFCTVHTCTVQCTCVLYCTCTLSMCHQLCAKM